MVTECDHIIEFVNSAAAGVGERRLVRVSEMEQIRGYNTPIKKFNFCPMCGEKITIGKREVSHGKSDAVR